jgi:hypothetical protein
MLQASTNKNTFSSKPRSVTACRGWEEPLQAAESRFDFLAIHLLDVFDVGLDQSLRVFLSVWKKFDAAGFGKDVLGKIFVVRLIAIEHRSFWQVKFKSAQVLCVVVAAGRKRDLDWTSFCGGYHVDFQSVEKTALAAVIPPISVVSGRFGIDSTSVNPDVIADFDRAAIDEENILGTGHLVQSAEPLEERRQDRIQRVEPSVKSASAKPNSKVGWAFEQVQSSLEVPTEEASGHDRSGHHFRVGDGALRAFMMATSSEPNAHEAVNGYDSGVHWTGSLRERN